MPGTRPPRTRSAARAAAPAAAGGDGTTRGLRLGVAAMAFVAAFLERWWFAAAWRESGSLTSAFYYGDAQRLVENAIAILQGHTFDNGIPYHPPGWPLALAAFLHLVGAGSGPNPVVPIAAVKALLAALSAAAVATSTLIAYEVSGFPAMLVVAVLGPFHFGHIVEGTVADTEALYSLLAAVAVYGTLRASGRDAIAGDRRAERSGAGPLVWTAVVAAAGAYAMLVRAEFVACAIVLIACIAYVRRDRWWAHAAVFAVIYGLVLVPTTVSHWRSIGAFNAAHVGRVAGPLPRFAPVTSYGPFNFAMANHEEADGSPNRDHPMLDQCSGTSAANLAGGQLDLACPAVYELYVHGYRIGLEWMMAHPIDALALAGRKLSMASGFLAHGYLIDDAGSDVSGTRRRVDLVDPDSRVLLPVHLALLLGGIWVLRRRLLPLAILAAPLVAFLASTVLFFGYVRLGTSYLPIVWALQATAIAAMFASRTGRAARLRQAAVAAGILVVLLAIEGLRVGAPRQVSLDGPRTPDGMLMLDETLRVARVGGS